MERQDFVDVLRAVALMSMLTCHFPIFLSSGEGNDAMLYFLSNHLLGGDFGASWFLFLSGLSQVLSANKRSGNAEPDVKRAVIRGVVIFIIGLLFLLIVQGYEEIWDWDVLTLIGATTIILIPCRNAPSWLLLLVCSIIFLITPWLRSFIDITPFYGGKFENVAWISNYLPNFLIDPLKEYQGAATVLDNIIGFFLIGQFPIFPWIIFPLIGYVVGRRVTQNLLAADSPFIVIIGAMFTFMGLLTAYAGSKKTLFSVANDYIVPLSFYPNSFSMIMLQTGVLLLLFITLWRIFDAKRASKETPGIFLTYCRQISKYSFTIYVSHFVVIFVSLRIIQAITGKYYLRDLVNTPIAFALSLLLLALYYPLLKVWDRAGGKYGMEWLLARMMSLQGERKK